MPESGRSADEVMGYGQRMNAVGARPRSTVDAGGEHAAGLRGLLYRSIAELDIGDVLEVISGHLSSRAGVPLWCRRTGHELLTMTEYKEETLFWIRKRPVAQQPSRPVPFAASEVNDEDTIELADILGRGRATMRPAVREFEQAFAQRLGIKHAIAVNSGAAAMHLALDALQLHAEDEVIIPTLAFTGSAAAIRHFRATPVLVDVQPDTLCVDPDAVEAAITPRTRAIVSVHSGGEAPAIDKIMSIARAHRLPVIEDAAYAFPSSYRGQELGTIGELGAFSFDAAKNLLTGEGGMLVTNNDHWAERSRMMSLHGVPQPQRQWNMGGSAWNYDAFAPGFSYGMSDAAAAIGVSQLRKVDRLWARRAAVAAHYSAAFSQWPEIVIPGESPHVAHSWNLYLLRLNLDQLSIGRDKFIVELETRGVEAATYFKPLHMLTYYRLTYNYRDSMFPVATRECNRILSLPIFSSMKDVDVDKVIDAVASVVREYRIE